MEEKGVYIYQNRPMSLSSVMNFVSNLPSHSGGRHMANTAGK